MSESDAALTLERAYRVRLRPNRVQERQLLRLLGAKRFVWNWAMARKEAAYRADGTRLNAVALSREFTVLRQQPDTAWLEELPREPFKQVLRDFDRAWANFFAGRARRPRFKRRGSVDAVRFTLDQRRVQVDREAGRVQLDGLGKLRFRVTEDLAGRLRSVTVRRDSAGRWVATFTADGVPMPDVQPAARDALGIDLGLASTAVFSDGTVLDARKPLGRKLARLRRYQRRYTRQRDAALRRQGLDPAKPIPKGTRIEPSGRMRRTQAQIGTLHAGIADARRDHQHQISAQAVVSANVIAIEDLSLAGMQRGMGRRAFRRGVGDAGLGELRRQIEYKSRWHGRTVVPVDRFYPSSKTCSACGQIHVELQLAERRWTCAACGQHHHRDHNAAINLEGEGLRILAGHPPTTRRSRGSDARGEGACADGSASPPGQPTSTNRELVRQGDPPFTCLRCGQEPLRRQAG